RGDVPSAGSIPCAPRAGCRVSSGGLPRSCRAGVRARRRQAPHRETRGGPRVRAALSRAVPLVAVLAAAAPVAQARAAELGERTLERGDRGDDVRQLQELLTKL